MIRYNIRVNTGNENITTKFYFVHKDWEKLTSEEQDEAFHKAVTELNRVYEDYGRFATQRAVESLFDKFGFIRSTP